MAERSIRIREATGSIPVTSKNIFFRIDIGENRGLYDYLLWTMFKIEDRKEIGKEIRQMVMKMKTVISRLIMTKEDQGDQKNE